MGEQRSTAICDLSIDSAGPTTNNGAAITAAASYTSSTGRVRRIIWGFDLTQHPSDFESARIEYFPTTSSPPGKLTEFHDLDLSAGAIVESEATWNKRNASTNWTSPGGADDYGGLAADTFGMPNAGSVASFDVTEAIRAAKQLDHDLMYFLLQVEEGTQNITFVVATKENISSFPPPQLVTLTSEVRRSVGALRRAQWRRGAL